MFTATCIDTDITGIQYKYLYTVNVPRRKFTAQFSYTNKIVRRGLGLYSAFETEKFSKIKYHDMVDPLTIADSSFNVVNVES